MLVFSDQNLVFLAVPKTGTSAIEAALKARADILFARNRKHTTAQQFHNRVRPFLKRMDVEAEPFAVIRDPIDQIRSWYKYRRRPDLDGKPVSTAGMSFDAYVEAVLSGDPPAYAKIGSQFRFVTNKDGALLVPHLFQYERQSELLAFLKHRFGKAVTLKPRNVSPDVPAPLDPGVEAKLRAARASEFALYDQIRAAGGYLKSDVT